MELVTKTLSYNVKFNAEFLSKVEFSNYFKVNIRYCLHRNLKTVLFVNRWI